MKKEEKRKNGLKALATYLTAEMGYYKITTYEDLLVALSSFIFREIRSIQNGEPFNEVDVFGRMPIALYPNRKYMYGDIDIYDSGRINPFFSYVVNEYKILDPEGKLTIRPVMKNKEEILPVGALYEVNEIIAGKDSIKIEPYQSCYFVREINGITMITVFDTLNYLKQFGRTITDMEVLFDGKQDSSANEHRVRSGRSTHSGR